MEAKLLNSLTTKPPLPAALTLSNPSAATARHPIFSPPRRLRSLKLLCPRETRANANSNGKDNGTDPDSDTALRPQISAPPENVEVRFRRRSSKRRSRLQKDGAADGNGQSARAAPAKKKKWEEMSASEKAIELYVGEKGALYWLNKLAYASIFIIIGGWIVFRFVGPALNLYQLDSPPLSPDTIFKGST